MSDEFDIDKHIQSLIESGVDVLGCDDPHDLEFSQSELIGQDVIFAVTCSYCNHGWKGKLILEF